MNRKPEPHFCCPATAPVRASDCRRGWPTKSRWRPKETIDFRAAATRVPGGLKGVRRFAEVFIPECESLMQTLGTEIPDGDPALVQRTAHTLKGSANLFSAKKVCDHAFKIEQIARSKELAAAVEELASAAEGSRTDASRPPSFPRHYLRVRRDRQTPAVDHPGRLAHLAVNASPNDGSPAVTQCE